MKKYEAIAKACEMVERTGQSGYIYNLEDKVAFFIEDGTRSIALIDNITLYLSSKIIEGSVNRHLNSQGWEVKLADYKDFTIEKMPWDKKITLTAFLVTGDIVEQNQLGHSRAVVTAVRWDEVELTELRTKYNFSLPLCKGDSRYLKVLLTCDSREIPEHLKG